MQKVPTARAICLALIQKALGGDVRAFSKIVDIIGPAMADELKAAASPSSADVDILRRALDRAGEQTPASRLPATVEPPAKEKSVMTIETFTPAEMEAFERVMRNALRTDFYAFVEKTFQTVCPGQTFWPNWHLEAICHALRRVAAGEIKRLIILVPPRSLKSICASVALPAWLLGNDPTCRIICVSYSADLAAKHARDCRAVMMAPWYRGRLPLHSDSILPSLLKPSS